MHLLDNVGTSTCVKHISYYVISVSKHRPLQERHATASFLIVETIQIIFKIHKYTYISLE